MQTGTLISYSFPGDACLGIDAAGRWCPNRPWLPKIVSEKGWMKTSCDTSRSESSGRSGTPIHSIEV
jgi:hypothetical protein